MVALLIALLDSFEKQRRHGTASGVGGKFMNFLTFLIGFGWTNINPTMA